MRAFTMSFGASATKSVCCSILAFARGIVLSLCLLFTAFALYPASSSANDLNDLNQSYSAILDELAKKPGMTAERRDLIAKNVLLGKNYINFLQSVLDRRTDVKSPEGGYIVFTHRAELDWVETLNGLGAKCRPLGDAKLYFPVPPAELVDTSGIKLIRAGDYSGYFMDDRGLVIIPGLLFLRKLIAGEFS